MNNDEVISYIETAIKCFQMRSQNSCNGQCYKCEYYYDETRTVEVFDYVIEYIKANGKINIKDEVNEAVHKTLNHLLDCDIGKYEYKSYLAGVLDLSEEILNE